MPSKLKLLGLKFGKLLVTAESNVRTCGKVHWECKCDCGNTTISSGSNLNQGLSTSCGKCCIKHGMHKTKFYGVWASMVYRCTNPNAKNWEDYGGRGISVCKEWKEFENFKSDMHPQYVEGLSLDRIDNEGGYCKENCRWTTRSIQSRNMRKPKTNTLSKYRNVSFDKNLCKYVARVRNLDGSYATLGYFENEIDAAKAVDSFVISTNLPNLLNFKEGSSGLLTP